MTVRDRLRRTLDQAARYTGLLRRRERDMRQGLTILMYHRVLPDREALNYPLPTLAVPRNAFAAQMSWLSRHARCVTVGDGLERLVAEPGPDRPLVAVTFDDGYADNAEVAAPILESLGLKATFFVATGFVERRKPLWYDRMAALWAGATASERAVMIEVVLGRGRAEPGANLPSLLESLKRRTPPDRDELMLTIARDRSGVNGRLHDQFKPMSVEQVRGLHRSGHEIGSHTVTHPILTMADDELLHAELSDSRRWLESALGANVPGFCYPNGDHDERVCDRARACGYGYAVTTSPGLNRRDCDRWRLRRIDITPHRVLRPAGDHDEIGFRAELSRLRELWR